jgi:peptide chain release factor 2
MLYPEAKQLMNTISVAYNDLVSMLNMDELNQKIQQLDKETYQQDFWSNPSEANIVIKQLKSLKRKQVRFQDFIDMYGEIEVAFELGQESPEMLDEFEKMSNLFMKQLESLRIELLLTDENDNLNAIIEIHPGAGGTESQDWASMLYRMYTRYAENERFSFELLDYLPGDEAGIKSVTFAIRGENAFGYLKAEHGVHRLVRISPFDSGGRRHTSFASVTVIPELDDSVDVELNMNEIKIDTYRSSGAGGQSVNTTDSAVRVTHHPTGIVVTVQNERSQIKNRETALKILKSKLYMLALQKKQEELSSYRSDQANAFGSQIRSYVLHPYSMVKDHRTNAETGNVQKVLDGDITLFIEAYLRYQLEREHS